MLVLNFVNAHSFALVEITITRGNGDRFLTLLKLIMAAVVGILSRHGRSMNVHSRNKLFSISLQCTSVTLTVRMAKTVVHK